MRVNRCPSFLCLGGDDGATEYGGSPCSTGIAIGMDCCFSTMAVATATDDAINQEFFEPIYSINTSTTASALLPSKPEADTRKSVDLLITVYKTILTTNN